MKRDNFLNKNSHHFGRNIYKYTTVEYFFLNFFIKICLLIVSKGPVDDMSPLDLVMAWHPIWSNADRNLWHHTVPLGHTKCVGVWMIYLIAEYNETCNVRYVTYENKNWFSLGPPVNTAFLRRICPREDM